MFVVLALSWGSVAMARHPGIVMNYRYSEKAGNLYHKHFPNQNPCVAKKGDGSAGKRAIVKTSDNDRCDIGYTCPYGYDGNY